MICIRVSPRYRYGHGVLRNPDPRFTALLEFCDSRPELLADPVIQMVKKVRMNWYAFTEMLSS